ncbi:low temperature requirement protein A [Streptomyces fildesensis]|uniref:Low temperature requirement protein A n=1 Tax=Streptomyces fildesensis TaxID=375757 RepID=A0ABW8C2Q3_9ACTN
MSSDSGTVGAETGLPAKRVSWVELYFDLVYVYVVSRLALGIVKHPDIGGVWLTVFLFAVLWWTWIGFAVLYNRHGDEERRGERLVILAGTLPCAVAGAQVPDAVDGHYLGFGLALAAARLLLAGAHLAETDRALRWRPLDVWTGYVVSAVALTAWGVWGEDHVWLFWLVLLSLGYEATRLLAPRHSPAEQPGPDIEPRHLAERFGLFMIIMLGEVVAVGAGADPGTGEDFGYWCGLVGGLVLAATLWWIYFDAVAEAIEHALTSTDRVLSAARTLYAGGHLRPAFGLLLVAAGLELSLAEQPHGHLESTGSWLLTAGVALYLSGNLRFFRRRPGRTRRYLFGASVTAATVCLAFLVGPGRLTPRQLIPLLALWTILTAVFVGHRQRTHSPAA